MGETGTGKSTLAAYLLLARRNTIAVRTKSDDTKLPGKHVRTVREIERDATSDRFLLEPKYDEQRDEVARSFHYVWKSSTPRGGWTHYVDELLYVDQMLGLGRLVDRNLTQGRSMNITQICGMQRPVGQTRYALSESRHVITFALDGRDARTFGEATSDMLRSRVMALGKYEALWYYRPDRQYAVVRLGRNGKGPLELVD